MRLISCLFACGALAASALSQSAPARYPLPDLAGSTGTTFAKAASGPGGTTYALLEGETAAHVQLLGIAKVDSTGSASLLTQFDTGVTIDPANPPLADLAVDKSGNSYLMFDTADNGGDVKVTKWDPSGVAKWTVRINDYWKDDDWNLHPMVDHGVNMAIDPTTSKLFVLSSRQGNPILSDPYVQMTQISFGGHLDWSSSFQYNTTLNRPVKVADNNGNPVAVIQVIDNDSGFLDMMTVDWSTDGSVRWTNLLAETQDVIPVDVAPSSDGFVFGSALTVYTDLRSGLPYLSTGSILLKEAEAANIYEEDYREIDPYGRPGQVNPSWIVADTNGGAYLAGSTTTYGDDTPHLVVHHYDPSGTLLNTFSGRAGTLTSAGLDGYSNLYLTGAALHNIAGTMKSRPFIAKVSPALDAVTLASIQRKAFDLEDQSTSVPTGGDVTSQGVTVIPVTGGNPLVAATEGTPSGGGFVPHPALLKVTDLPELLSVSSDQGAVFGGYAMKFKVTLDRPAPASGFALKLLSNSEGAFASRWITVGAGNTTQEFTLGSSTVDSDTPVTLHGGPNYLVTSAFVVEHFGITISTDKTSYEPGDTVKVTVTLSTDAPSGGLDISLKSSDKTGLKVPATVHFDEGRNKITFTAIAGTVYTSTPVTISGGPGFVATASILVNPLNVTMTSSRNSVFSFGTFAITFTLDKPAPAGGYRIDLKSSAKTVIPVQDYILIPAGETTAVRHYAAGEVDSRVNVTISGGPGLAASVTVAVLPAGVRSVGLSSSSVLGGDSVTATVTLTGPAPSGGADVDLSSTIGSIHTPTKITIPAGETTGTATIDTDAVTKQVTGYVSATFNSTARAALTLDATEVSGFTTGASVLGGNAVNASVTLNRPAPTGGLYVTISSDRSAIPSTSVTVPEGQTSLSFTLSSIPVTGDTPTTLTAKTGAASAISTTTVLAPSIVSVTLDDSSIASLGKTFATITINGNAPAGGISVAMSSSSSAADVAPTVTIPGGHRTVRVLIHAGSVLSSTPATITATFNASSSSAVLTVTP